MVCVRWVFRLNRNPNLNLPNILEAAASVEIGWEIKIKRKIRIKKLRHRAPSQREAAPYA